MNPITAIKLAGLASSLGSMGRGVGRVFTVSGEVGGEIGGMLGPVGHALGTAAGYAAPVVAANYAANQFAPTRRAKTWIGQQLPTVGQHMGQALVPKDFGARPGDLPGGY